MKNALVTGVSWTTGIGFAISKQLIEDGFYVYAIYHSEDSTAKNFYDQNPGNIKFLQCEFAVRYEDFQVLMYCISLSHLRPLPPRLFQTGFAAHL